MFNSSENNKKINIIIILLIMGIIAYINMAIAGLNLIALKYPENIALLKSSDIFVEENGQYKQIQDKEHSLNHIKKDDNENIKYLLLYKGKMIETTKDILFKENGELEDAIADDGTKLSDIKKAEFLTISSKAQNFINKLIIFGIFFGFCMLFIVTLFIGIP